MVEIRQGHIEHRCRLIKDQIQYPLLELLLSIADSFNIPLIDGFVKEAGF